jgi:hypothetical protein
MNEKKDIKIKKNKTSNFTKKGRLFFKKFSRILGIIILISGFIPFPIKTTESDTVSFEIIEEKDGEIELGESKVVKEGQSGKKETVIESTQNLWGWLLGLKPSGRHETSTKVTQEPVNKITAKGTKKYQYMICSDGSYRYYTDEQFSDPSTGFTSKSEDGCKENRQGIKVRLSNEKPYYEDSITIISKPDNSPQSDSYEADKIRRETEKLNWCSDEDEKIGNEYIDIVQRMQAVDGVTNKEFNSAVSPAYFHYQNKVKNLQASGCSITSLYPDFTRK